MNRQSDSCTDVTRTAWRGGLLTMVVCTLVCVAALTGRAWFGGIVTGRFLLWNLFLAWVPYVCSMVAGLLHRWRPGRWGLLIVPAICWLAFLPNAPYIVTDLKHVGRLSGAVYAYDAFLISTFAVTGCLLGAMSLLLMQSLVCRHAGRFAGWTFALAILGLSGLGVYVGRVLRWNSWWLVTRPSEILDAFQQALADPLDHPRAILLSTSLALFLVGSYILFYMLATWLMERPARRQYRAAAFASQPGNVNGLPSADPDALPGKR